MTHALHCHRYQAVPALLWSLSFALLLYFGLATHQVQQPVFFWAAAATQASLLALPAWLWVRLLRAQHLRSRFSALSLVFLHSYALTVLVLIYANYQIHALYGFYINSFVWNILITPGGIEALGVSPSFYISGAERVILAMLVYYSLYRLAIRYPLLYGRRYSARLLLALFLVQAGVYAYANHTGRRSVLLTAETIPWYPSITAKTFFTRLGIERRQDDLLDGMGRLQTGKLEYPAIDSSLMTVDHPYNLVWLVAESWRADMLNPQVMPATSAFANDNIRFANHYSGGNGTRMGVFTQFYGLFGSYWFDVLNARQPPLLLELLRQNGYQMKAYTSAKFSYPEFDRTVFSGFKPEQMQSYSDGEGWQRDRKNVGDLVDFIDRTQAPFFAFMFFESPHANYYFPPESVVEPDYLVDFNYLETDIGGQIGRIKARYINACAHLDSQIARVLNALRASGRLDDTIVVVTGDHGEEFMEQGHWGHNSTFSEQQIRVPLVLHIPGQASRRVSAMTSHLDLPPTLLAQLSASQALTASQIGFGRDLLAPQAAPGDYLVVSDWHGNALISQDMKLVLSPKAADGRGRYFSRDDRPLAGDRVNALSRKLLQRFLQDSPRFYGLQ